jgi:hypothetical protein
MEFREAIDTCYHEAAHAVVAIAVGAYVNYIEIGPSQFMGMTASGGCSWGTYEELDLDDIYAIFAAGYVSDIRRGSLATVAERQSAGDRIDLRKCIEGSKGIFLTDRGREIRFRQGIDRAAALLDKPEVVNAWQRLTEELVVRLTKGTARVLRNEVLEVISPFLNDRSRFG